MSSSTAVTAIQAVIGISSFFGVVGLLAYLYAFLQLNTAESSISRVIEGDSMLSAHQVVKILGQFKDDNARLKALEAITSYSRSKTKVLYEKVKSEVDVAKISRLSAEQFRRKSLFTGLFFLALALAAAVFYKTSDPRPPTSPAITQKQASSADTPSMGSSASISAPSTASGPAAAPKLDSSVPSFKASAVAPNKTAPPPVAPSAPVGSAPNAPVQPISTPAAAQPALPSERKRPEGASPKDSEPSTESKAKANSSTTAETAPPKRLGPFELNGHPPTVFPTAAEKASGTTVTEFQMDNIGKYLVISGDGPRPGEKLLAFEYPIEVQPDTARTVCLPNTNVTDLKEKRLRVFETQMIMESPLICGGGITCVQRRQRDGDICVTVTFDSIGNAVSGGNTPRAAVRLELVQENAHLKLKRKD